MMIVELDYNIKGEVLYIGSSNERDKEMIQLIGGHTS